MPFPSSAALAQGTQIQRGNAASPEMFTTISECRSIRGPSLGRDLIDVTNHDSTGGYREFVNGLKDAGEVQFDMNYIPSDGTQDGTTGVLADYTNDTRRNMQLVFPDASSTTWAFTGIVTGAEGNFAIDEVLLLSVTYKITGAPDFAA